MSLLIRNSNFLHQQEAFSYEGHYPIANNSINEEKQKIKEKSFTNSLERYLFETLQRYSILQCSVWRNVEFGASFFAESVLGRQLEFRRLVDDEMREGGVEARWKVVNFTLAQIEGNFALVENSA